MLLRTLVAIFAASGLACGRTASSPCATMTAPNPARAEHSAAALVAFVAHLDVEIRERIQRSTAPRLGVDLRREAVEARLQQMCDLDQFLRGQFDVVESLGLARADIEWLSSEVDMRVSQADARHTSELRGFVARNGWPKISEYGETSAKNAWLLVQHADQAPDFQEDVLLRMAKLVDGKDVDPVDYAYLTDRVAVNTRKKQTYGTQGRCAGKGVWEPGPIEDAAKVDERRAAIHLPPISEYKQRFVPLCHTADPP
jgi:hypothetical protein